MSKFIDIQKIVQPQHLQVFKTRSSIQAPGILRILMGLVILTFLLIGIALYFVPWVQTATGTGQVTALRPSEQVQTIQAFADGQVNQWFVQDGDEVKKGDPIVEVIDLDPQLLERLDAERLAISQKLDAARATAATAKLDYTRQKRLFEQGLAARSKYEAAKIKFQEMLSKEASVAAELNQVDVRLARQSSQIVKAPRDGVVFGLLQGGTSTLVSQGDPLVTFAPEEVQNAIQININGLDAALVAPGKKARVAFEGWPVVQFSGWPSHAIGTFGGIVQSIDPAVSQNGQFRVLIVEDPGDAPWPDRRYLRLGARAQAWVILDTVRLGFEIWRKMNGFPPNPPANITGGAQP